ncbi:MAG: YDG/SRA domain-containing protein [Pyrinomonadaceae bacterium]
MEVSEIHCVRNGIYQRSGRLISLLTDFGRINRCYPDVHGETQETILYTGSGRRGDQKLDQANRALLNAIESGRSVPLFNKLAVGRWEFTGFWKVTKSQYIFDEKQNRMLWKFTLTRA